MDFLRKGISKSVRLLFSALVISGLAGCSLQDFDYLKNGGSAGGGSTGSGGSGGDDAEAGLGGSGGTADGGTAGQGGSAGRGGSANTGGGGMLAEAGTPETGAGDGGPISIIVNGGFEQGYTGWTFDPASAMGDYAKSQVPVGTAVTIDGVYELATWSDRTAFTVRVFQPFSGLPSGKYTLSGHFTRGAGLNAAYLYANCDGTVRQENVLQTGDLQWVEVGIGGIDVTTGQCEVGFYVDSNIGNWLNADAFSFTLDPQ
jgi:hypothetical protein